MKHPRPLGHNIKQSPLPTYAPHYFLKYRASDWSRKKKSNFAGFLGTKSRKNGANLAGKKSVKKRRLLWLFSGQISLEIDRFCADQTSVLMFF